MSNGVITGGWAYVWAAYGLTAAALLLYGATLFVRLRALAPRQREEGGAQRRVRGAA